MSKLFNRKSPDVIEYGLGHTLEEFVENYSNTSATKESLTKAYNEINGNKTKSKITVTSGDGKPDEPLKPVCYAMGEDGNITKVDTTNIPTRKTLSSPEKAKAEGRRPGIMATTEEQPTTPKKGNKATPAAKPKAKKEGKVFNKPAATTNGAQVTGSKRDAIRALLEENSELSGKEIKAAIIAQGFKSIYDSEIGAVKKAMLADQSES